MGEEKTEHLHPEDKSVALIRNKYKQDQNLKIKKKK